MLSQDNTKITAATSLNHGISNARFLLMQTDPDEDAVPNFAKMIGSAHSCGMKILTIDKHDYDIFPLKWVYWFIGSSEAVIMFNLLYKRRVIKDFSQREINKLMKKIDDLRGRHKDLPEDRIHLLSLLATDTPIRVGLSAVTAVTLT